MKVYSHAMSLCSQCKEKVQAKIIEKNSAVFLRKFCPAHGFSETLLSSDVQWYEQSRKYVKPKQNPIKINKSHYQGCSSSCGLCSEHQQHTCLPIIEINEDCNLSCPVCLKNDCSIRPMSVVDFEKTIDNLIFTEGKVDVVNISGGEPTLHPDLSEMFKIALSKGITQVSLSTNGLALLKNESLRKSIKDSGVIVALQFDGFKKTTYETLRGADLAEDKLKIINLLEKENISYSLVATVAAGVNDVEITAITDFFFNSAALTLMFQPIAFSGHATKMNETTHRLTIPDVIRKVEDGASVKKGDFNPLPCSHYSCFALSYYLKTDEKNYLSLKEFLGSDNYLNLIANKTLPGLDQEGFGLMKERLYELWSAADSGNQTEKVLERIKSILKEMGSNGFNAQKALHIGMQNMKAVFIHHFMDVHNFDFGRLIKCCNPYARVEGLVPMCSENNN